MNGTSFETPQGPLLPEIERLWDGLDDLAQRLGRRPRVGVALGGGSALGVAHAGVLSALDDLGVPVDFLAGTSAGSLVGALYAAGIRGRRLVEIAERFRWRYVRRINMFPRLGLANNEPLTAYLHRLIGDPRFDELRLPFEVTATHLASGRRVALRSGPVIPAVRASCALPAIFDPVEIDGERYCDGGLLAKVPVDLVRGAGVDLVIAVSLESGPALRPARNLFEVLRNIIDIVVRTRRDGQLQDADVVVAPGLTGFDSMHFRHNPELIRRGHEAGLGALTRWRRDRESVCSTATTGVV